MTLAYKTQISIISEKRAFVCPQCKAIDMQIADDPARADALVRLANSIRPPT
jgi:hypothetical protein